MQSAGVQKLQRFSQALDTISIVLVLCLLSSTGSCGSPKSVLVSVTDVAMPGAWCNGNHASTPSLHSLCLFVKACCMAQFG